MGACAKRLPGVALTGLMLLASGCLMPAQQGGTNHASLVRKYHLPDASEPHLNQTELIENIRAKIKYVFVIYQENRSFDSYFGTFPGAEGLFSRKPEQTPGFYQEIVNTDGTVSKIHPFRIGPREYAADTDDIDHSHPAILAKMDTQNGVARMDKFAVTEELKYSPRGNPSLKAKQFGELAMAYEDCDTVPLLWAYADKFVLFDHIFQLMTGPSTPGNLSIIGAQTGVTQWMLHPEQAYKDNGASEPGVPVLNDAKPFWGSAQDVTPAGEKQPYQPGAKGATEKNLTYATLPLTMMGGNLSSAVKQDRDPAADLADVQEDIGFISQRNAPRVPFGWFQEGYDKEPGDDDDDGPVDASGTHASYVTHHNGPQYFGYISRNPEMSKQLHGLDDFFKAVDKASLPAEGGVFYIKGGYKNTLHLLPADPSPAVQKKFLGDDDHPAYSDAQISEALVATAINKIAASPYWKQSAIVIAWDDSEGDYDHVPPPIRNLGPDGSILGDGPRVPLIVISPWARTQYVAHEQGNHASVVKFIDQVFNLPALALLPDEYRARMIGEKKIGGKDLGPEDALTSDVTDLLGAFSAARLLGKAEALPASYVMVPEPLIHELPQKTGYGCRDLGIVTTDRKQGITNVIPPDFNPRPSTTPTPVH
ncbi:MAG TPA: alkaline phosphatase family protein [Candidatus Angelobacter sp.]|nr:alkaline phosphatase family protein [Candidatus Angelobacter sp.]